MSCFRCGENCTTEFRLNYVDDKGMDRTVVVCSEFCGEEVKAHFVKLHESRATDTKNSLIEKVF